MDIFSTLLSMQAEISLAVVLVVLLLASLLDREPNSTTFAISGL